jgi:hypothetical protein
VPGSMTTNLYAFGSTSGKPGWFDRLLIDGLLAILSIELMTNHKNTSFAIICHTDYRILTSSKNIVICNFHLVIYRIHSVDQQRAQIC